MLRRLVSILVIILWACGDAPAGGAPGASTPETPAERSGTAAAPNTPSPDSSAAEAGPVVVFLGTSLTAGQGLPGPEEAYPARVDALADSAGRPIRSVNAGVSGETSAGGLRRLDWVLRTPVDILVLELGANDGLRGQDPDALRRNLTEIIQRTRTRYPGARVLIAGMQAPPNMGTRYTEAFARVFSEVAQETDAELVPFLLEGVAGQPELNQDDGIHPTAEGHERMARLVWPHLEPLVRAMGEETGG